MLQFNHTNGQTEFFYTEKEISEGLREALLKCSAPQFPQQFYVRLWIDLARTNTILPLSAELKDDRRSFHPTNVGTYDACGPAQVVWKGGI